MNRSIKLFVCLFLLFISTYEVDALSIIDLGVLNKYKSTGYTGGSSRCAKTNYQGCWNGGTPSGYRFTLVDKTGKKVEGTRSVDFASNESLLNDLKGVSSGVRYKTINDNYGYKYSRYYNDYNDSDDFIVIFYKEQDGLAPTHNNFANFKNEILSYQNSLLWRIYDISDNTTGVAELSNPIGTEKYSFLDVFLHYCNYLPDYDDIELKRFPTEWAAFADKENPLYLLVEPTYKIYYNEKANNFNMTHSYGTLTEFADKIYYEPYNGLGFGLSGAFTEIACDYVTPSRSDGLSINTNGILSTRWKSCVFDDRKVNNKKSNWWKLNVEKISDASYGYGGYVFSISDVIPECEDCNISNPISFDADYCLSDDGIVSFQPSSNVMIRENDLKYGVDVNGKHIDFDIDSSNISKDPNEKIACYDSVTYDFSDAMNALNGEKIALTYLSVPSGTANVVRTCWIGKNATYSETDVINDYLYPSKPITMKAFKKDYSFNVVINPDEIVKNETISKSGEGSIVQFLFNVKYEINDPVLIVSNQKSIDKGAFIKFATQTFGQSNKFLKNYREIVNFSDIVSGTENNLGDDSERCYFDMQVTESKKFNFRVISLENPFPARDGSIRLPGLNWLDKDNKVFDYIVNNRGIRYVTGSNDVSPEEMYNKVEPMYSFTLTPSTMLKIREYNKKNKYDSMYTGGTGVDSLVCNSEGRECYSEFIRDSKYISQNDEGVSGVCFLAPNTNDNSSIVNEFSKITVQSVEEKYIYSSIYGEIGYVKEYDMNMNNRMDADDLEIALKKNKNKNTQFYTCANKSFLSGGPIEGGS